MAVGLVVPLEPVITWKSTPKAAPQIATESGVNSRWLRAPATKSFNSLSQLIAASAEILVAPG